MPFSWASVAHAVADDPTPEQTCLTIAFYSDARDSASYIAKFDQLYRKAGLCMQPLLMPLERAHGLMMEGKLDGQSIRMDEWVLQYGAEFVTLPTPVIKVGISLVSPKGHGPEIVPRIFLEGQKVGVFRAEYWGAIWVMKHGGEPVFLNHFKDIDRLFSLHRIDHAAVLTLTDGTLPDLDRQKFERRVAQSIKGYHILARHQSHLAPLLDRALIALGGTSFMQPLAKPVEPE